MKHLRLFNEGFFDRFKNKIKSFDDDIIAKGVLSAINAGHYSGDVTSQITGDVTSITDDSTDAHLEDVTRYIVTVDEDTITCWHNSDRYKLFVNDFRVGGLSGDDVSQDLIKEIHNKLVRIFTKRDDIIDRYSKYANRK